MSIIKLHKVTLFGSMSWRDRVLEQLQELGCVHLVCSNPEGISAGSSSPAATPAHQALKYLRGCSEQRRPVRRGPFDRERAVSEALRIRARERDQQDERATLIKAIRDLEPWGEFQVPDAERIAGLRLWFYAVPLPQLDGLRDCRLVWSEVNRDIKCAYVVVVSLDEPEGVPGALVPLDPRPLSVLREQLQETEEELEDLFHRRVGLTRFRERLSDDLDRADDEAARARAARLSFASEHLFAVQAWAPATQEDALREFARQHNLAITVEPPEPDDEPPTLLQNPTALRAGEGCVNFYKTPNYRSWDPSIIVFFSFSIFFAMILADAGYGAVLGILLLGVWKKLSATANGRAMRNLLLTLVLMTIGYGLLANSVFGFRLALLDPLHVFPIEDAETMMPLTIAIGVAHLLLANLISAWQARGTTQALAALGWATLLVGGTAAAIGVLGLSTDASLTAALTRYGGVVSLAGLGMAIIFSSDQPLLTLRPMAHLRRLVQSGQALMRFSSLFGDVLSYLRLFALGLASARLAATFNELGIEAWRSHGVGVVLAMVIFLGGHTLNVVLSLMSGVVHGMRLNCIEFFNWSLSDEGKLFEPFRKKAQLP